MSESLHLNKNRHFLEMRKGGQYYLMRGASFARKFIYPPATAVLETKGQANETRAFFAHTINNVNYRGNPNKRRETRNNKSGGRRSAREKQKSGYRCRLKKKKKDKGAGRLKGEVNSTVQEIDRTAENNAAKILRQLLAPFA